MPMADKLTQWQASGVLVSITHARCTSYRSLASLLVMGIVVHCAHVSNDARAAIVNGSFESGNLTGWSIIPPSYVGIAKVVHQSGPYLPTDGDLLLAATLNATLIPATLEFEQSFVTGVGDSLEFDYAFNESHGFGAATLLRPGFLPQSIFSTEESTAAGWHRIVVPFTAAGDYTLRFTIIADGSEVIQGQGQLLLDNVVINPLSSPTNPILPTTVVPAGPGEPATFLFGDGASGQWFDPPVAEGYTYQMTSGSLFTKILDFPTGFSKPFTVTVGGTLLGHFGPGESADFTGFAGGGVESFRVSGLDPGTDPDDPSAFPLKLLFNTNLADFSMQPIVAVPEPNALLMAIAGLVAVVAAGARRARQRLLAS